jgi:hypothetical protein
LYKSLWYGKNINVYKRPRISALKRLWLEARRWKLKEKWINERGNKDAHCHHVTISSSILSCRKV